MTVRRSLKLFFFSLFLEEDAVARIVSGQVGTGAEPPDYSAGAERGRITPEGCTNRGLFSRCPEKRMFWWLLVEGEMAERGPLQDLARKAGEQGVVTGHRARKR